jgi:hypothetical protein
MEQGIGPMIGQSCLWLRGQWQYFALESDTALVQYWSWLNPNDIMCRKLYRG